MPVPAISTILRRWGPALVLALLALLPFVGMISRGEVPLFRDHESYFLPLRWHTATSLLAGDLPLWNPFNGLGEPWMANPQTAVFYPPAWIFLALPFAAAYALFLAVHVAIAGIGAWRLFRRWAEPAPAWFGAVALMLSGPLFSLLDVNNNLASFAWLPLILLFTFERRENRARSTLALVLVLSACFLGGEPVYAAIGALAVALALGSGRDWRGLAAVAFGTIGLTAVQLFPFLAWIAGSDRSEGLEAGEAFRHSMAVGDWLATVMSTASATGRFVPLRIEQQFIPSLYLGVPTVILALASGLGSMRAEQSQRRRVLAMLLLSFTCVLILAAVPGVPALREWLLAMKVNAIRYPARLVPVGALLLAGMAAIGLDRVRSEPLSWRLGITVSIALLGGLRFLTLEPMPNETTALRFGLFLAWMVAFGLVYVAFPRWLAERRGRILLVAALAADLLFSSQALLASGTHRPDVRVWGTLETPWRIARVGDDRAIATSERAWLGGYLNLYDRRFSFDTAAPVVDSEALELYRVAIRGDRDDLVDLAGVRWVLSDREQLTRGYRRSGLERNGVRLFENEGAQPPAQFRAGGRISGLPAQFSGTSVEIEHDFASGGVVVVTQLADRDWRVTVDGAEARAGIAHGMFRAVEVPAGRHAVDWRYRPRALLAGAAITLLAVIALTMSRARAWKISRERSEP